MISTCPTWMTRGSGRWFAIAIALTVEPKRVAIAPTVSPDWTVYERPVAVCVGVAVGAALGAWVGAGEGGAVALGVGDTTTVGSEAAVEARATIGAEGDAAPAEMPR
jgi:hypothetical protein